MTGPETAPEPDWKSHAIALATAIQRFRNEPALRGEGNLLATQAYGNLCDAWLNYRDDGGPILGWDELLRGR